MKQTDFVYKQKLEIPTPPEHIDSLLVNSSIDCSSFGDFKLTSLEQKHKFDLSIHLASSPLLDFVDILDDANLIKDGGVTNISDQKKRRTQKDRPNVSWLRRTEYVGTTSTASKPSTASSEANGKTQETSLQTISQAIESIKASFEVPKSIRHPTDPSLTPTTIYEILPGSPTEQILFDTAPNFHGQVIYSDHTANVSFYSESIKNQTHTHLFTCDRRPIKLAPNTFIMSIPRHTKSSFDNDQTPTSAFISHVTSVSSMRQKASKSKPCPIDVVLD
jgi:hypothetical protein